LKSLGFPPSCPCYQYSYSTHANSRSNQSVRRYATPPGPASGASNTAIYAALSAAALGGGGYYYYQRTSPSSAQAPPSAAEQETVPATPSPSASAPQTATFTGGDQGFIDLKLESVEEINHNTKKFRFALPNKDDVSGLQIASALLTKYKGPGMEKPVVRPYTPTSDEDARGYVDLLVKRYPNGPMSEHMHDMEPDQRLDFKGPVPKYEWQPNKHDHIALIAGGTGITPSVTRLSRFLFPRVASADIGRLTECTSSRAPSSRTPPTKQKSPSSSAT